MKICPELIYSWDRHSNNFSVAQTFSFSATCELPFSIYAGGCSVSPPNNWGCPINTLHLWDSLSLSLARPHFLWWALWGKAEQNSGGSSSSCSAALFLLRSPKLKCKRRPGWARLLNLNKTQGSVSFIWTTADAVHEFYLPSFVFQNGDDDDNKNPRIWQPGGCVLSVSLTFLRKMNFSDRRHAFGGNIPRILSPGNL